MGATLLLNPIFHICFGSQLNGEKIVTKLLLPPMDVPQGTFSCAKRNLPCVASDKKAGKPFGRLQAARRARAMDDPSQHREP